MKTRALVLYTLLLPATVLAQDAPDPADRQVYFGEQHLHTQDSPDAFFMGTRNSPDEAYRFCKGEAIQKRPSGYTVQRRTPYDWCAVTDHAMYMGIMAQLLDTRYTEHRAPPAEEPS